MATRNESTGIVVSSLNSTATPLASGSSFVGAAEQLLSFEEVSISLAGAPAAAPGQFYFEFSPDGVHWDVSIQVGGIDLAGPVVAPQFLRIVLPFFRVKYINGATPLTELRLTTVYHRTSAMRLTRYLNQQIDDTEGVQVEKSIVAYKDSSGYYHNAGVDSPLPVSGTFKVSNFPANQTITGSVGVTGPITGSVGITAPVSIGNFPAVQNVVGLSGSVVGLLQGGQAASMVNPIPITGSVYVLNQGGAGSNVTAQSGSVTGLLVGGVAVSAGNPLPISGSISVTPPAVQNVTGSAWTPTITGSVIIANRVDVTGSVGITAPVAVSNFPASFNVGNFPATQNVTGSAWTPTITGSVVVANRVDVTGSVGLTGPITGTVGISGPITGSVTLASAPTVNQGTSPWTVGGSVSVGNFPATQNITGSAWTPTITGSVVVANQVNVTGSVGLTGPITGTVAIASSVAVNNFPASQTVAGTVTANQGTANAVPWAVTGSVQIVSGGLGVQVLNAAPGSDTGQPALAVRVISSVGGGSAVTVQSGSVTGLLVGGVAVSSANPVPITGSVGITGPITGSVTLASAPTVNQGTNPWTVGGSVSVSNFPATQNVTGSAWTPTVTGSVIVANQVNVTGSAWTPTITGSVVVANQVNVTGSFGLAGPITGTVAIASSVAINNFPAIQNITGSAWTPTVTGSVIVANQVNVTGSVGLTGPITGTVAIASSIAVNNFPASQTVAGTVTANQGTANATPWAVTGSVMIVSGALGAQVLNVAPGSDSGQPALAVRVISSVGGGSQVATTSGSVVGLLQGGQPVDPLNPVPVQMSGTTGDPGMNPKSIPVLAVGLVNDVPEVYFPNELRPLSLNTEGRLRVSVVQADNYIDFFGDQVRGQADPENHKYTPSSHPYGDI